MDSQAFSSLIKLYGQNEVQYLHNSHVAVIGIGGVGSWSAEILARSGIGKITLVDLDEICISNSNRQIHTLTNTIGQSKVQVMGQRLKLINPQIQCTEINDFFSSSTAISILENKYDYVIDAIDSFSAKCLLVSLCKEKSIPIVTVGAAGGKTDPTQIKIDDLAFSFQDMLLKRLRKKLKQDYGFPKNDEPFGIPSVFIDQKVNICKLEVGEKLNCEGSLGSAGFVTSALGIAAASVVVNSLIGKFRGTI